MQSMAPPATASICRAASVLGRDDPALKGAADRGQQVDAVAGQRIGPPRLHRRPEGVAVVAGCIKRHAAMAVGAGKAAEW
jgi:hypothetical protein